MKKGVTADLQPVVSNGDGSRSPAPSDDQYTLLSLTPVAIEPRTRSSVPPPLPTAAGHRRSGRVAGRLEHRWGPLFFMFCTGAFLLMVGMAVGAKMIAPGLANAAYAQAGDDRIPAGTQAASSEPGAPSPVIAVELQQIIGDHRSPTSDPGPPETAVETGRSDGRQAPAGMPSRSQRRVAASRPGKKMDAQSRAMIERMGASAELVPSEALASKAGVALKKRPEGLGEEQLYRVISRGKRQLQRCYETALRYMVSDETIRLDVDLTVGRSGRVDRVNTRGRTLGDMEDCIERAIRAWRFPPAGRTTRSSFPLIFQPGR